MDMMRKSIFMLASFLLLASPVLPQDKDDDNIVLWSADKKLSLDDFGIKTKNMESGATSAQFMVDYKISGLNFLTKNFNKKVRNYMIKSASQIDTTGNVPVYLLYQQTLFDICEVYTRQFRKALRENRKKLLKSTAIAEDLNNEIMTAYALRRGQYTQETNAANYSDKQKEWQMQIAKELEELADFAYEK